VVHENPSHQLCGYSEEMRATLPVNILLIYQAHIRLVDKCGRLQRVARPLVPHVPPGEPVKFFINERQQFIEGSFVTISPGDEQLSYLVWLRRQRFSFSALEVSSAFPALVMRGSFRVVLDDENTPLTS